MSGQGSGGYPQGQGGQNPQQQMLYQQQMVRAQMQQQQQQQGMQQGYGMQGGMQQYQQQPQQQQQQQHNMQQQMMGQPGPQMNQQQQSQPRSPMVQQGMQPAMNMGQSPMAVGNPLSVGALSQHNMGPGSVQGPLSVQPIGGPQSASNDYVGPNSVNLAQQPLSVPQATGGPQSVGPMSVNQQPMSVNPSTPNPLSTQQNLAPSTPAQVVQSASNWSVTTDLPKESTSPEPLPAMVTDPAAFVKNLILKDLRHTIVRMNINAGDSLKERKQAGSSGKQLEDIQEEQLKTMDDFLAVCDQIEANLSLVVETTKHVQKFEKIFDKEMHRDATQGMNAIESYIESTSTTQKLLDNAMTHLNQTREKLKKREQMNDDSMDLN